LTVGGYLLDRLKGPGGGFGVDRGRDREVVRVQLLDELLFVYRSVLGSLNLGDLRPMAGCDLHHKSPEVPGVTDEGLVARVYEVGELVSIPAIPVAGRRRVASFSVLNTRRSRSAMESMISQKVGSRWLSKGRVKARATRGSRLPGPAPTSSRFGVLSISSIVALFRVSMRVSSSG